MSGLGKEGLLPLGTAGALTEAPFILRLLVYTSLRMVRNEENRLERTAVIMSLFMFVSFSLE